MSSSALQPVVRFLRQMHSPASDGELLRRYASERDADAFAALVARHGPLVWAACRRVVGDLHLAEDAFQTTFIALARQARTIRRPEALPAWLYGVAVRTASQARAALARRRAVEAAAGSRATPDPLAEISGRELVAIIDEELAALQERYRLPLLLCGLDGFGRDEVAARLGCTLGTLRGRLERGRELLRQRPAARGLTVPAVLASILTVDRANALPPALVAATCQALLAVSPAPSLSGALVVAAAVTVLVCGSAFGLIAASRERERPELAQAPVAQVPGAPEPAPRLDLLGDPLPSGAVARIGTNRFVLQSAVVAFSADGRLVAAGSDGSPKQVRVWESQTGRPVAVLNLGADDRAPITELAFSRDARLLAMSGFWRDSVQLWDIASGQLLRAMPNTVEEQKRWGRQWQGQTLVFSADGRTLFGAGKDGRLHIWDIATGRETVRLGEAGDLALALSVAADGASALTAHSGGELHLWDLQNRQHLRRLDVPALQQERAARQFTALAPDGSTFVRCNSRQEVEVRDSVTSRVRLQITGEREIVGLAFAADGRLWIARNGGEVTGVDLRTAERRPTVTCSDVRVQRSSPSAVSTSAWFSPDGRTVAWKDTPAVRLWDLGSGQEIPSSVGYRKGINWVGFTADGRSLLTGDGETRVGLWDAATGKVQKHLLKLVPIVQPGSSTSYTLSLDRRRAVLVTHGPAYVLGPPPSDGEVFIWDPANDQPPVKLSGQKSPARAAVLTADNRCIVATENTGLGGIPSDGLIGVFDAANGRHIRSFLGRRFEQFLRVTSGSSLIITSNGDRTPTVRLYSFATGELIRELAVPSTATSLAISPDNRFLAASCMAVPGLLAKADVEAQIIVWQVSDGREICRMKPGRGLRSEIAFSPSGQLLGIAGGDGWVSIREVSSGQERRRFSGHDRLIHSIDFSPDGRRLATGGSDCTALIWQLYEGKATDQAGSDLNRMWADLAKDAATAHMAIGSFVHAKDGVDFIARNLRPESADKPAQAVQYPITNSELLRKLRAVEVLEYIATPAAREHLKALASGAPGAELTVAAREALRRLER